jgi:hypothetical protein
MLMFVIGFGDGKNAISRAEMTGSAAGLAGEV